MMRRLPADDSRIELPHWSELRSVRGLLSVVLSGGAIMVTKVLATGQLDEVGWTNEDACGQAWPWWHAASFLL
jgi:tRNA A37 threonylcarbamoyltransferase TsaD